MPDASVPYYLKPKDTKLPAGHDDTLDPPEPPTDAETRGVPVSDWPAADLSKGSDKPPEAPIAPPAVDPAVRSVPASTWRRTLPEFIPGRAVHLAIPVPDLDPDIALWRRVIVSIWPFTGAPAEGEWPKGWLGIDNTSAVWVCTVGGEPGTWRTLGAAGPAGGWPTNNGTGPGNLTAETAGGDTVGYNMTDQGSGGFTVLELGTGKITLQSDPGTGILLVDNGSGGVELKATSHGNIVLDQEGSGVIQFETSGTNIVFTQSGSAAQVQFNLSASGQVLVDALPTSDPSIAHALWDDNGVVVLSGSTTPLGDTGWIDASGLLQANWTVTGGGVCQYRRINGVTFLQANIDAGAGATNPPFTVPAGFRPGHAWTTLALDITGSGSAVQVSVAANGAITITTSGSFTTSFDIALTFPADA